ncbi:MAG TPA: cytochrome c oxidase assembly protein [Candidatus Dormibacteraeota bacterium]|jgi:putative membrane protein|nr:cytochrome c oxidase assembly protein [Candidatus Dormibacteraeota bacterium]
MQQAHLSLTDWTWDPTVLLGLAGLVAAYVLLHRRGVLRAEDDTTPWFRRAGLRPWFFGAGVLLGFIALQSPIDTGGDRYLLSLHMVQHLVLMMISPPLVLLGIAGMRPLPGDVAPRRRRVWTAITRPWPATLIFNVVLLAWHIPSWYDATLTTEWIHIVEHITFIAVGVVFWWPIVDPLRSPTTRTVSAFSKIGMLGLAGVPPTVLGFLFALFGHAVYDFYARAPRLWGLSAVSDQQIAGVIMFGIGNIVYFVAISVIFLRLLGNPGDDEAEIERTSVEQRPA